MQRGNKVKNTAFRNTYKALFFLFIFSIPLSVMSCTKPLASSKKLVFTPPPAEAELIGGKDKKNIIDQRFLPKDKYGLVDWKEVINRNLINPASSLDPDEAAGKEEETADFVIIWSSTIKPSLSFSPIVKTIPIGGNNYKFEMGIDFQRILERIIFSKESPLGKTNPKGIDFILKPKVGLMADAYFPHNIHTYWLDCKNCHPSIFPIKDSQLVRVSMTEIFKGEFCGKCHGKVAFPVTDCGRCHLENLL
ncbi:MAG: hypothetical protein OEV42_01665 [Deltaproteobacteria bacterium]|nr:hypothetical protein [Deltaproteobacteria bacterium]